MEETKTMLSDEEWLDYKVRKWLEGDAMHLSERDKGAIIDYLVKTVRTLNKEVEDIKLKMKGIDK